VNSLLFFSILAPLTLLSLFPHQEPRFLLPLLIYFSILGSNQKIYHIPWFLFNAAFALLYGSFHQSGVIPALLNAHHFHGHMIFYQTYMPPRYLVQDPSITVHDLMGASLDTLEQYIDQLQVEDSHNSIFISSPATVQVNYSISEQFCPHLSVENLPVTSFDGGFFEGLKALFSDLCLNVYKVEGSSFI
jgi:phosphatidylinositol glycan class Z